MGTGAHLSRQHLGICGLLVVRSLGLRAAADTDFQGKFFVSGAGVIACTFVATSTHIAHLPTQHQHAASQGPAVAVPTPQASRITSNAASLAAGLARRQWWRQMLERRAC